MPENTDEFIDRIRKDELGEQEWMTPVAYAHVRPIQSPQIYQLARNNKLALDGEDLLEYCKCGRRVLNVRKADTFFSQRRSDWPVKPGEEADDDVDSDPQTPDG